MEKSAILDNFEKAVIKMRKDLEAAVDVPEFNATVCDPTGGVPSFIIVFAYGASARNLWKGFIPSNGVHIKPLNDRAIPS